MQITANPAQHQDNPANSSLKIECGWSVRPCNVVLWFSGIPFYTFNFKPCSFEVFFGLYCFCNNWNEPKRNSK